ncbi:MAG: PTS mannose/fructose/sorbose transporter family subunit IID, partial [Streptococcus parasanguinis]|nr:PTS mannose/fructose/sorbose transporter family subunit IID [Streptococcus parasanguinis]
MQNLGWAYSLIPAIKKLYTKKEDQAAALERHMEFFNTHPYVAAPIIGVTLALEEERANGAAIDDAAIQGVKIGMMGPLAGIGDPVFWFTVRPILGALGASLAASGNILGPLIFFIAWNAIRMAFLWYTQELGYKAGSEITKDMSGGILQDITKGASILGMFILAVLVERWVSIKFVFNVSSVKLDDKAFIHWDKLVDLSKAGNLKDVQESVNNGIQSAFNQVGSGLSQTPEKVTTFQQNLDSLIPGLMGLLLTFACMWLLKKKVSPITIIIALFVIGVLAHVAGLM